MSGRTLLISLRPRFAQAIYSGEKKFELRRTSPKGRVGRVFIYETAPVSAITGFFEATSVRHRNKRQVWTELGDHLSLQKSEFDEYLKDRELAVTIGVGNPVRLGRPVHLQEALGSPEAPQSFRFLKAAEVTKILGCGFGSFQDRRNRFTRISQRRIDVEIDAPS